jgi:hypothetical protein
MATPLLEPEHEICQFFAGNFRSPATLADLIVLTEYTAHIAIRKKYGARTIGSHQGGLLPEMRSITGDDRQTAAPAKTYFPSQSIDMTLLWTHRTVLQDLICPLRPHFQFTAFVKGPISCFRSSGVHFHGSDTA